MTAAPLWRQLFDAVEQRVAASAEDIVASDRFADTVTTATRATAPAARLIPTGLAPDPGRAVAWVGGQIDRALHRTRNGVKVLTGFDEPELATSPREVVWECDRARLYRYHSAQRRHPTPVLMSLVSTPKVFDLRLSTSFVAYLLQAGFDVYLLDWGIADHRDAGNHLDTYVDHYLPGAVAAITELTGAEQVDVVGYCFGGVLALLYAASQPERVRRLTVMAAPVDWSHMGPLAAMTRHGRLEPEELFDHTGNVPAEVIKHGFTMLQPTAQVAGYASLLQHLDNDAFVEQFRAVGAWVDEHVPFPGACFADLTRALVRDNTLLTGTTVVGERTIDLTDVDIPLLCVVAEKDHICPPEAATPVVDLVSSDTTRVVRIPAGHIGLIISRTASKITLPAIVEWLTGDATGD
jgi:poly[(R)-3-hydroxyalkanoate] polymerase subunit PhaC